MVERVRVPLIAKEEARNALNFNNKVSKSQRVGLNKSKAQELGINSGIERAKQLIRSKYISEQDARAIARFYQRFKNCRTTRCEAAISLWGGRKFGKDLVNKYYK